MTGPLPTATPSRWLPESWQTFLGTFLLILLGTFWHFCRGWFVQTWSGTCTHSCLGTSTHFCSGTSRQTGYGTWTAFDFVTSEHVSYGLLLQVPAIGAHTLSLPWPSHWYSQSSLYSVEHSCLVVGWHRRWVSVLQTFSYSVVQTSVSVSVYSVSQIVAY